MNNPNVEVIVRNVGTVYSGSSLREGRETFAQYQAISKSGIGRAGGEDVTLMLDDNIVSEYVGTLRD